MTYSDSMPDLPMTQSLKEYDPDGLARLVKECGGAAFRARQLYQWLFVHWAASFDQMTNLPKTLLEALASKGCIDSIRPETPLTADDETVKWLSWLQDGNTIETVLIRAPERNTVCVSTQVGCAVRCVFCASGRGGLVRNLTKAEIMDQVILPSRFLGRRVDNVVVMGMGEPMHNLDALIPALDELGNPDGFNLGARHVTISTSGVPEGIRRLADTGRQWNLALSLHAVDDETRARIIPDHHRAPLEEIYSACEYHREKTGRMLTLEYALVQGVNDSQVQCQKLALIALSLRAKVNLIPCNPTGTVNHAPNETVCRAFLDWLLAQNVQATIRLSKGRQIQASCGQLRQKRIMEVATVGNNQAASHL